MEPELGSAGEIIEIKLKTEISSLINSAGNLLFSFLFEPRYTLVCDLLCLQPENLLFGIRSLPEITLGVDKPDMLKTEGDWQDAVKKSTPEKETSARLAKVKPS